MPRPIELPGTVAVRHLNPTLSSRYSLPLYRWLCAHDHHAPLVARGPRRRLYLVVDYRPKGWVRAVRLATVLEAGARAQLRDHHQSDGALEPIWDFWLQYQAHGMSAAADAVAQRSEVANA